MGQPAVPGLRAVSRVKRGPGLPAPGVTRSRAQWWWKVAAVAEARRRRGAAEKPPKAPWKE